MRSINLLSTGLLGIVFVAAACGSSANFPSRADAGAAGDTDNVPAGDSGSTPDAAPAPDAAPEIDGAAAKIRHVIMIMQENRSFDHYFGMFPGADGFTLDAQGNPTNCNPDPNLDGGCAAAFHDAKDVNSGGGHGSANFATCYDKGKMDGFIKNAEGSKKSCADPNDPACTAGTLVDVMGYKLEADIPNYWAYAKQFVLQDHLFETDASWSWPMHQFMVSEWAAHCTSADPMSCTSDLNSKPDAGRLLLVDAAHVPARQRQGHLEVLPRPGNGARLRQRRGGLPTRHAARERADHLEPAAVLRGGEGGERAGDERRAHRRLLPGREGRNAAGRGLDRAVGRGERAPAEPRERRGEVHDGPHQRRSCRAPTGKTRRSFSSGTTGAASTTTCRP